MKSWTEFFLAFGAVAGGARPFLVKLRSSGIFAPPEQPIYLRVSPDGRAYLVTPRRRQEAPTLASSTRRAHTALALLLNPSRGGDGE